MAEEAFLRESQRIAGLPVAALARPDVGATIVYRDSLPPLFAKPPSPSSIAYSVVSVRRNGEKSPLSNITLIAPAMPPGAPVFLAVTPEEGRICLEWLAPTTDLFGGKPVAVGGYFVYRRALSEEEYGPPINASPMTGTAFVDLRPPTAARSSTRCGPRCRTSPKVEGRPPRKRGWTTATFFRRRPPRDSTLLPRRDSSGWSGTRWTRPTSPVTRSSGPKGPRRRRA